MTAYAIGLLCNLLVCFSGQATERCSVDVLAHKAQDDMLLAIVQIELPNNVAETRPEVLAYFPRPCDEIDIVAADIDDISAGEVQGKLAERTLSELGNVVIGSVVEDLVRKKSFLVLNLSHSAKNAEWRSMLVLVRIEGTCSDLGLVELAESAFAEVRITHGRH